MIDLGTVRPGRTVRIPFGSFAASTGAPSAVTNYAAADIQVYKDGNTTQRSSASGMTATTDFDTLTGVNLVTIDLSDNTTADFWASGSEYIVVISDITIDAVTMRFPIGRFRIGFADSIRDTTIATLASQTSFTLTAGSADNNTYIGCPVIINKANSAVQMCMGVISAYTGASLTVTLAADPAIFTIAAKDNVSIFHRVNAYAIGGLASIGQAGYAGVDWGQVANKTTANALTNTSIITTQKVDVETIKTNPVVNAGTITFPTTQTLASTTNLTNLDVASSTLATAANLATVAGYLDTEIAAILALLDDARGEPGQGNPPVNPDVVTKIDYLYKAWRNKVTQTATTYSLFADDAVTVDQKATVSDDGTTYSKGEVATGP
tara:strand:- start:840 stop:1976 length:1137 start_codon:yes stop_codon:yes gene_type:complete